MLDEGDTLWPDSNFWMLDRVFIRVLAPPVVIESLHHRLGKLPVILQIIEEVVYNPVFGCQKVPQISQAQVPVVLGSQATSAQPGLVGLEKLDIFGVKKPKIRGGQCFNGWDYFQSRIVKP